MSSTRLSIGIGRPSMLEYETFVYLDMEKTGSTFIFRLLEKFSSEQLLRRKRHAPMGANYDPKKFYFISVRNPLDCYLSLYSFGSAKRGRLYGQLRSRDRVEFYDGTAKGFARWLEFVLDPENAGLMSNGYAEAAIAQIMGLQTWRYLRLAVADADAQFASCERPDTVRDLYKAHKLSTFTVRHECFADDLCRLVEGPLQYAFPDPVRALDFARNGEPLNPSVRVDAGDARFRIPAALRCRLGEREWLLHEIFGY